MLLEQKVRQEAAFVDMSYVGGIGKARKFLKLAKSVAERARQLGVLCYRFAHKGDWQRANRFRRAYDRLSELHSELRGRARLAIRQPSGLSFDTSPTPAPFQHVKETAQ